MRSRSRTIRELGVIGLVVALVVGVVVAAVQADGQRAVRADLNDGGAWLINGSEGVVGHVNREAGEITGVVRSANPGARIDSEQRGHHVTVIDRSAQTLTLIDARTFQTSNTLTIPADTHVRMIDDAAVLWTESPLTVWRLPIERLGQILDLDGDDPVIESDGDGLVEVTRADTILAVDTNGGTLSRLPAAEIEPASLNIGAAATDAVAITAAGEIAAVLTRAGALVTVRPDSEIADDPIAFGNVTVLGQPTLGGEPVIGVTSEGHVLSVDPTGDRITVTVGGIVGADPLRPIHHRGCVFAVTATPPALTRLCQGSDPETTPLPGATGASLRLRLINNWIWVNDLRAGSIWVINESAPLDRVDDWGAALANEAGEGEESDEVDDGEIEQRENPDADDAVLIRADEIDEDGVNEPPVARDDSVATRTDLPVVIDVLRNDEDPDGDVILVSSVDSIPTGSRVAPTADRAGVQLSPPAGFRGELSFEYTITDGRGGAASAVVTVDVFDPATHTNRAPIAVTDAAEARAGSPVALNVLDNDSDPDGDSIVLIAVTADGGTISFDPGGQLTYVPDPASAERSVDLAYTIADTFGMTAIGRVRVDIRLPGSNNEPDARNDSAVGVVGKPLTLNVLLNDTDPDGDAISVAGPATLVSPIDATPEFSLSFDGQLFFYSDQPGTYLLNYSIVDGSERDAAQIRIDIVDAEGNQPPVAVRDDVTIPRGGTGTAYVLLNDSDPDGDVVAIDTWLPVAGLEIEAFRGLGFLISVAPDAPDQVSFRYSITDGINDPTSGVVVVAVSSASRVDQPPVVTPDVVEVRPGGTTTARVLLNDYDPEAGALRIDRVSQVDGVTLRIGPTAQEIFVTVADDIITGFTFGYDVVDAADNRAATFVDVRIVPDGEANRPPTAKADTARTRSATPVNIPVLENDSDPDGDLIRVESIAAQPAAGTASVNDDGTITYLPDPGFRGTDRFQYVVTDQFGGRAIGDVLVGVIPETIENRPPTAVDDEYTVVAGSDTAALPVLANDYDPDGDPLTIIRTSGGPLIEISGDADTLLFTPPDAIERESVDVTITYRIDDGRGGTGDALVRVTIVRAIDPVPPVPADDSAGPVRAGDTVVVNVLANDTDPDGLREELTIVSNDGAGEPGDEPGTLVFVAGEATSTHAYTVTDADGLSGQAFVTIIVIENVAPTLEPLAVETPYETPITLDVGRQAADVDDDPLFFVCCDTVRGGRADVTATSEGILEVTFTPDPEFEGQGGFSYSVDDKQGHLVSGSVTVTVSAKLNSPPTAQDATVEVEAGTSGTISLAALADDPDIATGDELTFVLDAIDGPGISLDGATVNVVAAIDSGNTTRSLQYTVTDRESESASGRVDILITEPTAPPPTAISDQGRTTQGVAVTVDVTTNDVDPIGGGLRIIAAGSSSPVGTISVNESGGTITLEPLADFFGTARISYTIEDARRLDSGRAVGQLEVDVVGFPGLPPTPVALADNATATVTWGQPAANGAPIEEIELESDQAHLVSLPAASSHTFNGLVNGVAHRFRLRARNEAGWGEWSAWSAPVTPDTEPGRPAAPTVSFADQSLDVSWIEPANEGSVVTGYILEIGGTQQATIELQARTSYTWNGLTNGSTYQFRVTALNASGPSDVSAWSTAEHPLREPDQPNPIDSTRGNRFLDLVWNAPANNGDPIIDYQIEMQSDPGSFVTSTARNYRWADLANGVFQQFRVRARNRDTDWSQWSAWSNAVKPCGAPLAPTNISAVFGDRQGTVTWTEPGNEGCALSAYTLETIGGGTQSVPAGATSHVVAGLTNGQPYRFRIRATNEVGDGPWSANSNEITPAGPPEAPNGLTAQPVASLGEASYSANAPFDNGRPIIGYEISIDDGPGIAAPLSGTRTGLGSNTPYQFEVRACNVIGCGPYSNPAYVTTWGVPTVPTGLVGNGGTFFVEWSWNASTSNGPGLRYEGGFWDTRVLNPMNTTGTYFRGSWSGMIPYANASLWIRACNDLGCSADTASVDATPIPAINISAGKGASAQGQPGCSSPTCQWVTLTATGLPPGSTHFVNCDDERGGGYSGTNRTADSQGRITDSTVCYFGFPGERVRVTVGGRTSNWITW